MKLSKEDKEMIRALHAEDPKGWNISALAREYKVTRGAIQFTLDPKKVEAINKRKKERQQKHATKKR